MFAISDPVWISIVTGTLGLLGTIFAGLMAYFMFRIKSQAEQAAIHVERVAKTLVASDLKSSEKMDNLADVAAKTHKLVNSAMIVQLRLYALTTQRIATLTGASTDIEIAKQAQIKLEETENEALKP